MTYTSITQLTTLRVISCGVSFWIPRLLRRMVEKKVCNDYQMWKWTSCIVKVTPYSSFQAYTFGNERTIVAKIKE